MTSRRLISPEEALPEPTGEELLHLDIDIRLASLWRAVWEVERWDPAIIGALLRAAYGTGYSDALTEPRGKLHREHGYPTPQTNPGRAEP